jgi:thioredoxin-related protein
MLKRSLFRLVGTGLLLTALAVPGFCGPRDVSWIHNYDEGVARAKSQGKIAVVEFYVDDSSSCRDMDRKTFKDAGVRKLSKRFVMVKVNAMKEKRAMIRHAIRSFPTVLVLDSNEKEITRINGYRRPEDLTMDLKEVLNKHSRTKQTASR